MTEDIRWKQRFDNFKRAITLLREACDEDLNKYSQLEKEGIIQRFEYILELAWKVLKDRMENDGVILDTISPKGVVRQAFATKYLKNPEIWLKMIGDRNLMSHTYDFATFDEVIKTIKAEYMPVLDEFFLENFMLVVGVE